MRKIEINSNRFEPGGKIMQLEAYFQSVNVVSPQIIKI